MTRINPRLLPGVLRELSSRIFRELWVDLFVARAVDDVYDELIARAIRMLCRSQPGLTDTAASAFVDLPAHEGAMIKSDCN